MLRILIFILLAFHGLIHVSGFVKAFNPTPVSPLSQHITKTDGLLWLISAMLFFAASLSFILKKDLWWFFSLMAILVSQYLIFKSWSDAKYGTIANLIIILLATSGFASWNFTNKYLNEVKASIQASNIISPDLLTEKDIEPLPEVVKKYLRYTSSVNKQKVKNFKVTFEGRIRKNEQSEWMAFTSEQYNFIDASARLFFMKATMKSLPVTGFHCYKTGTAFMDIRLFSLFKVQYQSGREMDTAETVTFFNDMCCLAPATLIDKKIKWLENDSEKAKAEFTNNLITIMAWLYFNEKGELINFTSDNRYAAGENNTMQKLPWSTPIKSYKNYNGYHLPCYADAIYSYPEGDLCYGQFHTVNIEYNCKK